MNHFDIGVIMFVNQFSQHSLMFDKMVGLLAYNHLLKGGVLDMVIWWAWFKRGDCYAHNREHIIATLFSCIMAMAVARFFALILPFRLRPLHEESLSFLLPYGMEPTTLTGWSSFPSDHAALFFTLATGLLFISRLIGIAAVSYVTLFIVLPRIYLGLHYPTDILGGAIIGIGIALIGNRYLVTTKTIKTVVKWSESMPSLFYPLFFLMTFEIAEMFDSSRQLISGVIHVIFVN